jgi:hypothetical protein
MMASARMQRWALMLMGYRYDVIYRSTLEHGNADCMSRLPVTAKDMEDEGCQVDIFQLQIQQIGATAVTARNDDFVFSIGYGGRGGGPELEWLRYRAPKLVRPALLTRKAKKYMFRAF